MLGNLIDFESYPVKDALDILLKDRNKIYIARKNRNKNSSSETHIIWATDNYMHLGRAYGDNKEITTALITGTNADLIQPRVAKAMEAQLARTRKHAEVFTPSWVVNLMNNHLDEVWFGRKDVFNRQDGQSWTPTEDKIEFPEGKKRSWQAYINSRRLEITCGEAPYLVSRYDAATGEIIPLEKRIGLLDRKMRVVNENTTDRTDWWAWTQQAFRTVYGYEYQGDNLLIARINLLMSFVDYAKQRWGEEPTKAELKKIAEIISWSLWQMDGLKRIVPHGVPQDYYEQLTMYEIEDSDDDIPCRFYYCGSPKDKGSTRPFDPKYNKGGKGFMKFDFAIGNPPYQDETLGDNRGFAPPVYNKFLDAAFEIADRVEMIHPARFLFNAGSTPKVWNEQMLSDPHLKILFYEQDASKIFSNTEIKGGVVISYHDKKKEFGAIQVFSPYEEMNSIRRKAAPATDAKSLMSIIYVQNKFDLDSLYLDHHEYRTVIGSAGKDKRFRNNIFDKIPEFTDDRRNESDIRVLGVSKNKRLWKYIPIQYVEREHENLFCWKVLVARVNGSGTLGEQLSSPLIIAPNEGYTQTFIGIGAFGERETAENALKYVKSKFARTMLAILKITQDNNRDTWRMVPLQDFTPASDIDWSKSVAEIDQQLYRKYGLTEEEINFVETHVKEMA